MRQPFAMPEQLHRAVGTIAVIYVSLFVGFALLVAGGNVVGSNIANVLLILGVGALIAPVLVSRASFGRDGTVLVLATLATLVVLLADAVTRWVGAAFLAGLVGYLVLAYLAERRLSEPTAGLGIAAPSIGLALALLYALGGIAVTVFGAHLLVDGATGLAQMMGVSEAVIGLTIVAVGTSLPELVTAVVASLRGQADVAFGNVVGSNIYNLLGILGITALVHPVAVPSQIAGFDVWVLMAATAALVGVAVTGWRVTRTEGAALLAAYGAYVAWFAMAG